MKTLLAFALIFVFGFNCFGSPLVFRATKEISSEQYIEVGRFDSSKYKQLRIRIKNTDKRINSNESYRRFLVEISGIEKQSEISVLDNEAYLDYSTIIDTPPTMTKISIKGNGTFEVFVWAS